MLKTWISLALISTLFETSVLFAEEAEMQSSEEEAQQASNTGPKATAAAPEAQMPTEIASETEAASSDSSDAQEAVPTSVESLPPKNASSREESAEAMPKASTDISNDVSVENDTKKKALPFKTRKRPKLITVGLSAPLCGFAEGLITGTGWINTSSDFIWGNLDVRFLVRMAKRFALGGGITQSVVHFDGTTTVGGELVADFRWYAVPDYLYFKLNVYFGFPLLFALGPTMGHSFEITEKVHLYIENQFVLMVVAGAYGFWQPAVGAEIRF